ncbi:Uncharacterised protein [uncultured archaeon]|nr:Uncharacterised protein [uncultured archaeon]
MPNRLDLSFQIGSQSHYDRQRHIHHAAIRIVGLKSFFRSLIGPVSGNIVVGKFITHLVLDLRQGFRLRFAVIAALVNVDHYRLAAQGVQNPRRMIDLAAFPGGLIRIFGPPIVISRSHRVLGSIGTIARCQKDDSD